DPDAFEHSAIETDPDIITDDDLSGLGVLGENCAAMHDNLPVVIMPFLRRQRMGVAVVNIDAMGEKYAAPDRHACGRPNPGALTHRTVVAYRDPAPIRVDQKLASNQRPRSNDDSARFARIDDPSFQQNSRLLASGDALLLTAIPGMRAHQHHPASQNQQRL